VRTGSPIALWGRLLAAALLAAGLATYLTCSKRADTPSKPVTYRPRQEIDTGGYTIMLQGLRDWGRTASLTEVAAAWAEAAPRLLAQLDQQLQDTTIVPEHQVQALMGKACLLNYTGKPDKAYESLKQARDMAAGDEHAAGQWLFTVIYFQGVTALRRGESENCILCRGESSCILPIAPAAVHIHPAGSRQAIAHFMEYLEQFPDDVQVRWLLNLAHMTLGEHPDRVDPRYVIRLDRFLKSEFDIGRFRDIGATVGINRLNESGGTILDDFDNDGLFDVFFTTWDATRSVALYRNKGDGTFEDRTSAAKLDGQLGGLGCIQADFDNDGYLDLFLPRGAWLPYAVRPSLMRNNGDGTFTDVTERAGLTEALNSDTSQWVDFDNDGWIDLFVACERQPCKLYRNRGNGTFEDVTEKANLHAVRGVLKGCAWLDFDNDRYPDLFLNDYTGAARFFRNNRNGTFTDATAEVGIDGPRQGMSCWAWDYDNDGYLDIFATSFDRSVEAVLQGMLGQPHGRESNRLYRNDGGKKFVDVTKAAGLDQVFSSMGTNFGDFDNDGFLDFYLGTGDHDLATLVPNRMFRNVGGKRFADITTSSGTGNLQKGHGVGCGDWNRDGTIDIVIQMGGALPGDTYHNILFQNPGQTNNWLSVKLVGKASNRAAIGARIKVVTNTKEPLTICRHVSSGSSFGGNPLEQTIGIGKADRAARLEVFWPTTGKSQTFLDIPANQFIEIVEGETTYRKRNLKPIRISN
jgi:hypothetical protein